jgi:hypothetical protein
MKDRRGSAPGFFAQTHARPDLVGRSPVEILTTEHALGIGRWRARQAPCPPPWR